MNKFIAKLSAVGMPCLLAVLLQSCISSKQVNYFQDAKPTSVNDTSAASKNKSQDTSVQNKLVIQPYDALDIRVNSSLKALDILSQSQVQSFIPGSALQDNYFTGFLVDEDGNVSLPLVGKVHIAGLEVNQAKDVITEKMKKYLDEPFVDIKFLTFRVSVLGEVKKPGVVIVPNEKADLIEALSLAGDRTDFANSTDITIIRGNLEHPTVFKIDLTKMSAMKSAGFKLMPNDIIYVKPFKRKLWNLNMTSIVVFATILNSLTLIATRIK